MMYSTATGEIDVDSNETISSCDNASVASGSTLDNEHCCADLFFLLLLLLLFLFLFDL